MITFVNSGSIKRSSFRCPHCSVYITIDQIRATINSNSFRSVDGFHCTRCGTNFMVESKISIKATVYDEKGHSLEEGKGAVHGNDEEINSLF